MLFNRMHDNEEDGSVVRWNAWEGSGEREGEKGSMCWSDSLVLA